ncbi:conserved hypothetical protein [Sphingomonas sp. EC-HK361]|uniref:hypothetical protein n=1 Tax=Sphingomonas sp. EC-HK361 TaxID=2038397 RepID=UPI001257E122|nr:hypothetical protein [Sphingomonas sp. EC-HK361]VVT24042.1 conserved hypothetical protein [Sphingomonas sp. EC-HK361]
MSAEEPTLDAVLEAFMMDAHQDGALATYLQRHPQFSLELIDLSHEMHRIPADEPLPLDHAARTSIDAVVARVLDTWPMQEGPRNLFAELRPADYGRVSTTMGVPRGVIGAVKDGLAIWSTIPGKWLARLAAALGGTVDELRASIGGASPQASYKSEARPERKEPVPFEQLLIEARVDEARRAEIMDDGD